MCLLATCAATSWVKHRAVTEDAEYLFGCKVTKKFGVTLILCSYTPCFVCTVCNLAVLVYLLNCLAKPFLLLLEVLGCPTYLNSVIVLFSYIYEGISLSAR